MTIPFMRPVREEDFDAILALAQKAGGGMTNLPVDPKAMKAKIRLATDSFTKGATKPGPEVYMLVLDIDGKARGTAGVFSQIGLESGFINYKVNTEFYFSRQLDIRSIHRVLVPTHDFTTRAEVGMLLNSPDLRGGGYGKLLARSRYMFIAQRPEIVADHVCAELRGWRAPDGSQPFWNALGRRFFEMDFEEADAANAANGNQFIEDMMPRYPVYVELMPEDARACIGRPHKDAEVALKMLIDEGFTYEGDFVTQGESVSAGGIIEKYGSDRALELLRDGKTEFVSTGYIDVFDGGPLVHTRVKDLKTMKESRVLTVAEIADRVDAPDSLLASGAVATFRATKAPAKVEGDNVTIRRDAAAALNVDKGGKVRWCSW